MAVATSPYLRDTRASSAWLLLGVAALVAFGAACGVALAMGEIQALYVSLAFISCIAILVDYRIGAVLLITLLPISSTNLFPHQLMGVTGLNPINVLIVGTAVAYILRGRMENLRAVVPQHVIWLYIAPIVAGALLGMNYVDDIAPVFYEMMAISYTNAVGYLRDEAFKPLLMVVAALLIGSAVMKADKPERFIVAVAISACLLALFEFVFIIVSNVKLGQIARAGAGRSFFLDMGMHANSLGRIFVTAYALLLFVWWETKRPVAKSLLFAALGVIAFAILFTFSRAAFLGFFAVSGLFLLWKFNAKSLSLVLGGLAVAAMLAPNYVYERITFGVATGDANVVSAGRTEGIWAPLLPELWKSPIWGNGLSSIMWSEPMLQGQMEIVNHPHNAFLESFLDTGLVGLGLLLAFYWMVWIRFRSLGSNAYLTPEMRGFFQGACAAMLAFGLACMTGGSLRPEPENALLWVAIGMAYGVLARKPAA